MDNAFSLYQSMLGLDGVTTRERAVAAIKRDFENSVVDNPAYVEDCTRNGVPQRFMVNRSTTLYRAEVVAFPGEELYPGDMITAFGEYWIVYQTRVMDAVQVSGTMWLCNHLFHWQNGTDRIIEQWGVLDSGVYSTTKAGSYEVMTPDVQYKIYLPYNDDTKYLYVDKRLATNKRYDANQKEILEVYTITRVDPTSQAYGKGAHLLMLNVRSGDYIAERDNIEKMICDYIAPDQPKEDAAIEYVSVPVVPDVEIQIVGRSEVSVGRNAVYRLEAPADYQSLWTVIGDPGVSFVLEDGGLRLKVEDFDELIGTIVEIMVEDVSGKYDSKTLEVEVNS